MKLISFSEISAFDICISEILCAEYHWKDKCQEEYPNGRDSNILSFTVSEKNQLYCTDEKTPIFDSNGATIFFVAKDAPYMSKSFADNDLRTGHTMCIKFKMTDSNGEELIFKDKYMCWSSSGDDNYFHLFRKLINAYLRANVNFLNIKGTLYRILNELNKSINNRIASEDDFHDLAPAFKYLATDLGNNLSVSEIAGMCLMSASYFHRRFKVYTGGETFVGYRNRLRIEKAKVLLENPMWNITMVAETLGFYDTSHFYRVYKKYTGELPVHIKKEKSAD